MKVCTVPLDGFPEEFQRKIRMSTKSFIHTFKCILRRNGDVGALTFLEETSGISLHMPEEEGAYKAARRFFIPKENFVILVCV
jgi:hypothetical protein